MLITNISPAVKTPGRYNVSVDGRYAFSLDELQLAELKLKCGNEIDDDKLNYLKNESAFGKNYIRAIDLISRRLRSEQEIRQYGIKKNWTHTNIERVISRLYQKRYLDDAKFAEVYLQSRLKAGKYSLKRIRLDLKRKGLSDQIINNALEQADVSQSEKDTLKRLVEKKYYHYNNEPKLINYLARAGFSYDAIKAAISDFRASHD